MKQKHLTKEQRERIEKGIRDGEKLIEIAKAIDKDPTTISKEVKLHRKEALPIATTRLVSFCTKCSNFRNCKLQMMCPSRDRSCTTYCKSCVAADPTQKCNNFILKTCKRIIKFPYVCNGCKERSRCLLKKYEYIPLEAELSYRKVLKECRQGFNLTSEEYQNIDKALKDGTDNGQSIYYILSNNKLGISVKTGYNYVNSNKFTIKHEDLPYVVNHILKKRKVSIPKEYVYPENKNVIRKGREYIDYLLYVDRNNIIYHAELDCVGITKDYVGALFTIIIPKWGFLLLYKVEVKDMEHINACINFVYEQMGLDKFYKYLGVTLADRGSEFNDAEGIEIDKENGIKRTNLFYCDSGQSTQKPFVERINKEIRRFVPKGQSVENITQDDCDYIASAINSLNVDSLDGKCAYDYALLFLGKKILDKLNIKKLSQKELRYKNIDLIKYENKKKTK